MRHLMSTGVVGLILACAATTAVQAQLPSETLEKGIYNEETVGNLDEAIRLYKKVISDADDIRSVAARAQYRLGQCLLKQGKKDEAVKAFETVVEAYSSEAELVAKAKKLLPGLKVLPAPWTDGERLTLTMRLQGGQKIGAVGLAIDADELEGRPVWRMLARRFVSGGQNQGVSRVVVDRETMKPRRTDWDHTLLGAARAVWGDQKLVITKGKGGDQEEISIDLDGLAYSNDQTFYMLRMLPLEVGYKTTIPLRVAFTGGNPVGFEISVPKKEQIKTPAGTFDCFRLDTNIAQTFWVADNPERYVVRFDAGGVIAELSSIEHGGAKRLENTDLGFSVTVPDGWFSYADSTDNETTSVGYHLVSPDMGFATLRVQKKSLLGEEERESARAWAEAKIRNLKDRVKSVEVTAEITDTELAGLPGVRFIAEFETSGRTIVGAPVLVMNDSLAVELGTSALADQFDRHRELFLQIMNSFSLED